MKSRMIKEWNGRPWMHCWVLALLLGAPAASAQMIACDESTREEYRAASEEGLSDEVLEDMFGHCRDDIDEESGDPLAGMSMAVSKMARSNQRFERMNSCGYHPKNEVVSCDVQIRRNNGYGAAPAGSQEYVLVCLDCNNDGRFDYRAMGSVHVNDRLPGAGLTRPWFFTVSASTRAARNACVVNDQLETDVRAILSWNRTPRNCQTVPIWGNVINFRARRDP